MIEGKTLSVRLRVTPSALSKGAKKGHYCAGHPVFKWVVLSPSGRILGYNVPEEVCLPALVEAEVTLSVAPKEKKTVLPIKPAHMPELKLNKINQVEPITPDIAQIPAVLESKPIVPDSVSIAHSSEEPEDFLVRYRKQKMEFDRKFKADCERRRREQLKRRKEELPGRILAGITQLGLMAGAFYLLRGSNTTQDN